MRSIEQALLDHELLTLRVIAEWWELDLTGYGRDEAAKALAEVLKAVDMPKELLFLAPEESSALNELAAQGGRVPVAVFNRTYGDIRLMGPARMEREEPWLDPDNVTESLWYRGFLYRAFDETAEGLLEFYFLPNELLSTFPQVETRTAAEVESILRPLDEPPETWSGAVVDAVDDLTALLAVALQLTLTDSRQANLDKLLLNPDPERRSLLLTLAAELGLLRQTDDGLRPTKTAADWLKQSRDAQLFALADAWTNSDWNDLCHTPDLQCEGENWQNDPILARTALLDALPRTQDWYWLADLTSAIKERDPDFQRPDGNYDTWYIKDANQDQYLVGFDAWDNVERRLLRYLIRGPLYWLGMIDVADIEGRGKIAFRLSMRASYWLVGNRPADNESQVPIVVQPDGRILVPHNASRYHRFQVARIAESRQVGYSKPFIYCLTPKSLSIAKLQGIGGERLLKFLTQASAGPLPKSLRRAVERWEQHGVEGRLESAIILRVSDEGILETLRNNPRTRDFVAESLGELAVVIKPGMWEQFCAATLQLGLMIDADI